MAQEILQVEMAKVGALDDREVLQVVANDQGRQKLDLVNETDPQEGQI